MASGALADRAGHYSGSYASATTGGFVIYESRLELATLQLAGRIGRLELITQIPGHNSIAATARARCGGRDGTLQQQIRKIKTAAGFAIAPRLLRIAQETEAGRAG